MTEASATSHTSGDRTDGARVTKPTAVSIDHARAYPGSFHDPPELRRLLAILLHHYRDVLEGIPSRDDLGRDDELLALMCEAWNHPSYQRLEKLLGILAGEQPRLRQALRVRFERYSERRVAWCRKCGNHPPSALRRPDGRKTIHQHPPGRSITLQPKMLRVLPRDDDPELVGVALEWLVEHWRGELVLPEPVARIEAERLLREAA